MKENSGKEFERMEKLAAEIERNPMTAKFREDEAAEVLAKRRTAAEKIETLKQLQTDIILKREEIDDLIARLAILDDERRILQAGINQKQAVLARERLDIEGDIKQQEVILYETADPIIGETIMFFRDRWEGLLGKSVNEQRRTGKTNLYTEKKEVIVYSNIHAIQNAMAYCRAAIDELEKTKLTPDLDADHIEALRKGIPDANGLTESIRGEKPLPGSRSVNPRDLLPSDSETNWKIGKLKEKFTKLLGKPF